MAEGGQWGVQQVSHGEDSQTSGAMPVFFSPDLVRTVSWRTKLGRNPFLAQAPRHRLAK